MDIDLGFVDLYRYIKRSDIAELFYHGVETVIPCELVPAGYWYAISF